MGAQANPLKIDITAGLLDFTLYSVGGFELALFRTDKSEHQEFVLGKKAQRLEAPGTVGIIFREKSVDVQRTKQILGDGVVTAFRHPFGAEVAAAGMYGNCHIGRVVLQRGVDQPAEFLDQQIRGVTTLAQLSLINPIA